MKNNQIYPHLESHIEQSDSFSRGMSMSSEPLSNANKRKFWTNKIEFFLSGVMFTIGATHVWELPNLCFENGGGAFLIIYFSVLFLVGIPTALMEMGHGQFCSQGCMKCWGYSRLFIGIGLTMIVISMFVTLRDQIFMAWSIYYFFASFHNPLPWSNCGELSNEYCVDNIVNKSDCNGVKIKAYPNGTCYNVRTGFLYGIYDPRLAKLNGIKIDLPAKQYMDYSALQGAHNRDVSTMGKLRWELFLCMLFSWTFVMLILSKGVKSLGKAAYGISILLFLLICILTLYGLSLEGFSNGLQYLLIPRFEEIRYTQTLYLAVKQVFRSLNLVDGSLIVLSSYNRFNTDIIQYGILIIMANIVFNFLFTITTFAFAGHFAYVKNLPINEVMKDKLELVYVIFPSAINILPAKTFWAIIYFFMTTLLTFAFQIPRIEVILSAITDNAPKLRSRRRYLLPVLWIFLSLMSIQMCNQGGVNLFQYIEKNVYSDCNTSNLLFCISIVYIYGADRFMQDIEIMVGTHTFHLLPVKYLRVWLFPCWYVCAPVIISFAIFCEFREMANEIVFDDKWFHNLTITAWFVIIYCLLFLPMIGMLIFTKGSFRERIAKLIKPTKHWGPHLVKDRAKITYVEGFKRLPSDDDDINNQSDVKSYQSTGSISRWNSQN